MQLIYSQPFIIILLFSMAIIIGLVIIEARAIEKKKLRMIGLVSSRRFALKYIIGAGVGLLVLFVLLMPTLLTEYDTIRFNGRQNRCSWYDAVCVYGAVGGGGAAFQGISYDCCRPAGGYVLGRRRVLFGVCDAAYNEQRNEQCCLLCRFSCWAHFFGFYVIRTNSIWGAFGMHFAWNFAQGLFADLNVSGVGPRLQGGRIRRE